MGSPLPQEIHIVPSAPPRPLETGLVYRRNEQPRTPQDWFLYSFQWLVTMVYAVVWGYAIVGVGLNFEGARMTTYLSAVVLTIGVSTLLQAWLGHRMAMVHGPNVIPSLAIVAAFAAGGETYALQSFTAMAQNVNRRWSPVSGISMYASFMLDRPKLQIRSNEAFPHDRARSRTMP